jgi:hypothetical protein
MSVILFIVGILVTGAGIVTIGFGIPINEFNLGNTLIVSGTIAFSTGLILIGLAAAVDQLAQVVKALRGRAPARPQPQAAEQPVPAMRASPAQAAAPLQAAPPGPPPKAPMPQPRNPIVARPRSEASEPAEAQTEASSSAIERLRSSLVRSDVRPGPKAPDPVDAEEVYMPPNVPPPPASAGSALGTNGAAPPSGAEAPKKKPPLDFLFRPKAREPQAEPFESVWPKRGGRQADEGGERAGGGGGETSARPPAAEMGGDEGRSTGILKSGVVDGMAYTLYVDGSIEAQLPQGTVRFGSIAELRAHIENNS